VKSLLRRGSPTQRETVSALVTAAAAAATAKKWKLSSYEQNTIPGREELDEDGVGLSWCKRGGGCLR
jgi:hypothetical protein